MKKAKFITLLSVLLLLITGLVGCNTKTMMYPEWAFDNLKKEDASRAEGSDIRIMSANVLVSIKSWGGTPVAPRAQQFAEAVKHYTPDVIGLQEFDGDWYKYLPEQLEDYTLFDTKKNEFTTMMYNNKKLNLLDKGIFRYSKESNKRCRYVVWGVFETKESGKKFAVTTTHWDLGMEPKKVEMKDTQAHELNQVIKDIEKEYNVPVFATGDFNVLEKNEKEGALTYKKFLEGFGGIDAKFDEKVIKKSDGVSYDEESWDHIFIKPSMIQPLMFNILANDFYQTLSDHYLIYLDAYLI